MEPSAASRLRMAALLAPGVVVAFGLAAFHDPRLAASRFAGQVSYGAYQSTLRWYTWFSDHLTEPSAWFWADFQRHPFGVRPVVLWAGDFLTAALFAPFRALPTLALSTNAFVLALLAANVTAMALVLARRGVRPAHAAALGVLLGANTFVLDEIRWGRFPQAMLFTLPLFLDAFARFLESGGRRPFVAAVLLLGLTLHIYPYNGAFVVAAAAVVPCLAGRPPWRRLLAGLPAVAALGGLLYLPVALALVAEHGDFASFEVGPSAYRPVGGLLPDNFNAIFSHSVWLPHLPGVLSNPAVLACLAGLFVRGRVRALSVVGLLGLLVALGPWPVLEGGARPRIASIPLPFLWIVRHVPGWSTFSHPVRALALPLVLGLFVLGAGVAALDGRLVRPAARRALTGVLALVAVGSIVLRSPAIAPSAPPPSLAALRDVGDGRSPLILLPLGFSDYFQYAQIQHGRPTLNANGLFLRHKTTAEAHAFLVENTFLQWLRTLHEGRKPLETWEEADLEAVLAQGYREVVLVRGARRMVQGGLVEERSDGEIDAQERRVERTLRARFGPPVLRDPEVSVYALVPTPP